jgi:hypothetical protein
MSWSDSTSDSAKPIRAQSGHRRHSQPNTYVLWRFDPEAAEWTEIARSSSERWTWALDLRPIAVRAIEESRGVALTAGFDDVVRNIRNFIDSQVGSLPLEQRARAVAVLHDEFLVRFVAESSLGGGVQCGSSLGRPHLVSYNPAGTHAAAASFVVLRQ